MCVLCVLEQHLSLLYSGGQAAATMALCEFVAVLPRSPNAKILSASLHNQLRQTVCIYLFTHFVHVRTDVSATAQVRGKSAGVSSLFSSSWSWGPNSGLPWQPSPLPATEQASLGSSFIQGHKVARLA